MTPIFWDTPQTPRVPVGDRHAGEPRAGAGGTDPATSFLDPVEHALSRGHEVVIDLLACARRGASRWDDCDRVHRAAEELIEALDRASHYALDCADGRP